MNKYLDQSVVYTTVKMMMMIVYQVLLETDK